MVERQLPKLHTRVRFPSPAPFFESCQSESVGLGSWSDRSEKPLRKFPGFRTPLQIHRKLLSRVEKLNTFRLEIDKGIHSLDAGKGSALNMEDFPRENNSRNGREQAADFGRLRLSTILRVAERTMTKRRFDH
jgi:hypothetical protein